MKKPSIYSLVTGRGEISNLDLVKDLKMIIEYTNTNDYKFLYLVTYFIANSHFLQMKGSKVFFIWKNME